MILGGVKLVCHFYSYTVNYIFRIFQNTFCKRKGVTKQPFFFIFFASITEFSGAGHSSQRFMRNLCNIGTWIWFWKSSWRPGKMDQGLRILTLLSRDIIGGTCSFLKAMCLILSEEWMGVGVEGEDGGNWRRGGSGN